MKITDILIKNIAGVVEELILEPLLDKNIILEHPADKTHGDYSTNIALVLFGKLKKEKGSNFQYASPNEFAQAIAQRLSQNLTHESEFKTNIEKVSVAGPGFINFTLSDAFLLSKMGSIIQSGGDVLDKTLNDQKVMIEFTDPNPFKELHIGHLYSNVVGESIAKLQESLGAVVQRACYQGDVGMHVSKSIWGMQKLLSEEFLNTEISTALTELEARSLSARVAFLGRSYALGATAYSEDETAKKVMQDINYLVFISAQEKLRESTNFEPKVDYKRFISEDVLKSATYQDVKQLYISGRSWSLEYFNWMYARIGMQFDEFFFESLVGEYGYEIVMEYLEKGVFEESNGAVIFPGKKYSLHDRVFINSLGLPTYEAKELGLAPEKFKRFAYDKSVVITGNEIDEYFKVLLKALEFTSPDLRKKTTHLSHGMVRLPEGKMSSRTGKILTAEWLLDEAIARITTHMKETRLGFSETQINEIAQAVGTGAIKFAFLKQSIGKDISFSFDESLSFTGNSGPYMQYTYVRCMSVLEKAENELFSELSAEKIISKNGQDLGENQGLIGQLNNDVNNNIAIHIDTLLNSKSYLKQNINMYEKDLLQNLYKYSDIVNQASAEYSPHYVATYLYELAQSFNSFYGNNKVVTENSLVINEVGESEIEKHTQLRLLLVESVALIIKHGLELLGIETVDRM